ncbi:HalOD1 output domain-containing protein [Haloarcula sp. Atlit-7R]|uniref:HalOD1 output domain-containing protein n=1 Tax=Haloarcula sp. Atlit-7R TaxID=2282125 RepID=UPI001F3B1702|nr:HalOD1 output domain-containing protein [Haloarcula sp. Atlit-7R]
MAIVGAVAAATNQETTDLPPLQETIEADALDTLLDGQSSSVAASFQYAGTDVSVTGDGSIEVRADGQPRESQ